MNNNWLWIELPEYEDPPGGRENKRRSRAGTDRLLSIIEFFHGVQGGGGASGESIWWKGEGESETGRIFQNYEDKAEESWKRGRAWGEHGYKLGWKRIEAGAFVHSALSC